MAMVVKLFEMKWLSSGMTAKPAEIPRGQILSNLHRFNVLTVAWDKDELLKDAENKAMSLCSGPPI